MKKETIKMKKKLLSFALAAVMTFPAAVFAESVPIKDNGNERAVLICYDSGKLVYSSLFKSENGAFNIDIPDEYKDADKKIYYVGSNTFGSLDDAEKITPEETAEPAASPSPEATAEPTATPAPSSEPTSKPTAKPEDTNSPYEKEVDKIYAPALITGVARSTNADGAENTSLTVYYQGKEVIVPVEDEITISSAPASCADMTGQPASALKEGDVIYMAANLSGTKIKSVDLIMRPTDEDIATSSEDYGVNFEKVFTSGGTVAGKWQYEKYGSRVSGAKYSYAFGIVARKSSNALTLINKSKNPDDALDIDLSRNAYVYACDVSGKNYEFELGDIGNIEISLPSSLLNKDEIILDDSDSYNYALVRMVEGTATDIVVFNNYNS